MQLEIDPVHISPEHPQEAAKLHEDAKLMYHRVRTMLSQLKVGADIIERGQRVIS